jgi:hypothetical protein
MAFSKVKIARVEEVIMTGNFSNIGTIRYSEISSPKPLTLAQLPTARPLWKGFTQYPTINEIVFILIGPKNTYNKKGAAKQYYLPPMNIHGSSNHNALPSGLTLTEMEKRIETGEFTKTNFREIIGIKPLFPYEGDLTIEGRYGNSIRFGSVNIKGKIANNPAVKDHWSRLGDVGRPITIIRNGQDPLSNPDSDFTIENINKDDSSIYLCSDQQLPNFKKTGANDSSNEIEASYKHML